MRRSSFCSLCLFAAAGMLNETQAQKQTEHWYFGINAGLSFSATSPAVLTNGMLNTTEGSATISDANGKLLFYTDGVTVWDSSHTAMPNGTGLLGDASTTQSALIVKKPSSSTLYYIFTLPAEGVGNFCYSVVDMTLNGGKGDVTTKNTVVKGNVTEKMSSVYHCNGTDIWVTIHEWNTKSFYSYLVTAAGIGTAVVSTTGRTFTDVHGQMKFSPGGTRLAATRDTVLQTNPFQGIACVDVLGFNNQTGVITYSYSLQLGTWQKSYGLEFSRDNSRLYANCYDVSGLNGGNSELLQFDLNAANVQSSATTVGSSLDPNILRSMQLAKDGKIYVSKSNSPFICVVNTPTALGAACGYSNDVINVDANSMGTMCMLGLPAFVQSYFNPAFPDITTCTTTTTTTVSVNETGFPDKPVSISYHSNGKVEIHASGPGADPYQVTVSDLNGRSLFKATCRPSESPQQINCSGYPPGIYIITLEAKGKVSREKFVR